MRSAAARKSRFDHAVVIVICALLGACGALAQQAPGTLSIRNAGIVATGTAAALEVGLDCHLSGPMQDAFDHGIPITLQVDVRAGRWPHTIASAQRRIELRYFPLTRRYQLREMNATDVRNFPTPAYLLAALGALRVSLPDAFNALPATMPLRVSVEIDVAALPGALCLPALFEPAWHLAAKDYAWTVAAR